MADEEGILRVAIKTEINLHGHGRKGKEDVDESRLTKDVVVVHDGVSIVSHDVNASFVTTTSAPGLFRLFHLPLSWHIFSSTIISSEGEFGSSKSIV